LVSYNPSSFVAPAHPCAPRHLGILPVAGFAMVCAETVACFSQFGGLRVFGPGVLYSAMAPCGLQWGCLFRHQYGGWKDL